ncbi:MAG: hypothetical protein HQK67_13280, partial [Desulfamplus sp.]|nr:hypothetical protein [Desulfamplus sp.]
LTQMLLFIQIALPSLLYSQNSLPVYYVRFDVKSVDNRIERSNLLIVPSNNEFRQEKFTLFLISGSADYSASGAKGLDIQTRAAHNAIKNFLETNGLQSVKSQSTTVNGLAHDNTLEHVRTMVNDQTVVSFEGAVKLPYRMVKSSFDKEIGVYSVTIEIAFAPLAFPDKWEEMLLKYKMRSFFEEFKSFF